MNSGSQVSKEIGCGLLLQLRRHVPKDETIDAAHQSWLQALPLSSLQSLVGGAGDLASSNRDLLLRAGRARGAASATPKTEIPGLVDFTLSLASKDGPVAELEVATEWVSVAIDEVAAHADQVVKAIGAAPATVAERFEARLLEQLDLEPTPSATVTLLSKLGKLHPQNRDNLRQRLHAQLQTRARRANGESVLASVSALLGGGLTLLWQQLAEETRDQLYALLRATKDWSEAAEELKFLERHADELPEQARAELRRVFEAGAASDQAAVRRDSLAWAIAVLAPEQAQRVLDAFADRLDASAGIEEVQELITAADQLGATARVLWKLGEIGASGSPASTIAEDARRRLSPPVPQEDARRG